MAHDPLSAAMPKDEQSLARDIAAGLASADPAPHLRALLAPGVGWDSVDLGAASYGEVVAGQRGVILNRRGPTGEEWWEVLTLLDGRIASVTRCAARVEAEDLVGFRRHG